MARNWRRTIYCDRYCGSYSRGKWVALPCDPDEIVEYLGGIPNSDDSSEMDIWDKIQSENKVVYGVGDTAEKALADLEGKLEPKI